MPNQDNEPRIQRYIVKEDPRRMRLLSALHMKDDGMKFMVGIFLYFIMTEVIPNILGVAFPKSYFDMVSGGLDAKTLEQLPTLPFSTFAYTGLMSGAFLLGRSLYLLKYLRNKEIDLPSVLDGFTFFFRATLLFLIRDLIIGLLAMCFVIPGVIAYFSFSQAFYILAENPKRSVFECLVESRIRMKGNRMRLFALDLSFVFLILVSMIPSMIMQMYNLGDMNSIAGVFVFSCFRIPFYYAMGCLFVGQTVFYEVLVSGGYGNFHFKGEEIFRREAAEQKRKDQ